MLPLVGRPDASPQLLDLDRPRPLPNEQVAARLTLAATAPPAFVGLNHLGPLDQVRANCCVAGEGLEEPAGYSFPFSLEVAANPAPLGGVIASLGLNVSSDPPPGALS